ncbi:hypothetical protein OSB04_013951 [Centaurea solstitialis]|uniref:Glycosyltransferase N-terminal domain-containing protein n=1 Tax=Centaurea solstitialis TaxID=347529 RepID=A0AA38WFY4_9ASTR|nr:hypothetical protein OSB04_013951 [Centaurea solstitialis]
MVDMAKLLAQRGATVTIVTTPVNAKRFKSVVDRAIEAKLEIRVVELQLALAEAGLPDGCESMDLLPTSAHVINFITAMNLLEKPAEKMLRSLFPPPSCIISDAGFPWTYKLAQKFDIPRLVFYGPGCFAFLCVHVVTNTDVLDEIESDSEYFVLPGLPDRIEITKPQAATWGRGETKETTEMFNQTQEADKYSFGIVVNSFEELEPKYVEAFAKAKGKKVWCIGPVSMCNKSIQDIADRGNKAEINEHDCTKWLDAMEPRSVVYVCLGSLNEVSTEQAIELALGLELSNTPFIWFLRRTTDKFEKWMLEEGYEKRIKDRGLMVRGWAPQILILSHPAIGGFVTHCGWNSTLEGISAGIPMVTWPHFADQFLNERFVIDVLKIGVRIGAEVPTLFTERDQFKSEMMIKREGIRIAVESLMRDDEEGEARRKRAKEFGELAKRAMEEGDQPPKPTSEPPMASTDLHFVLFPLMAQGHLIPMVDMAKLLAQRGATVTIVTTPVNASRFKSVIDRAIKANLKIQVRKIQLALAEVGLPEGCENFDLLPTTAHAINMFLAIKLLAEPAEKMFRDLCPPPSCIISDGGFPWTLDLAKKYDIPRLVFYGPGCFAFLCIHIVTSTDILDEVESNSEYFVLPGLPDRIEVTKPQASTWGRGDTKETTEMFDRMQEAEKASFGIVVNSFEELEPEYVEAFSKAKGKKVWCVGPVSTCNKSVEDVADRGNTSAINGHDCTKWLDEMEPRSVVYVCLGSLNEASTEQAIELGLGLESSNTPFIWCVRRKTDDFEKWMLEEGYEERIKGRGMIVRGWAPQILILSHPAIGGFVTHCGWNSTLEGISAGIPLVTWPHFADQFLNERFVIDVLKIGVKIGSEVPILFSERDQFKSELTIKREDIKIAVESLMSEEEEGVARRKRAKEFGELAKIAMEEGGSSQVNMTLMIQAITAELTKNGEPNLKVVGIPYHIVVKYSLSHIGGKNIKLEVNVII